jgi:hypothetical protein
VIATGLVVGAGMWAGFAAASAAPDQGGTSPCVPTLDKTVAPGSILLGEFATVTLHVGLPDVPACRPDAIHVVLVLDHSGAVRSQRAIDLRAAADAFVDGMNLAANPNVRIGVVAAGSVAQVLCDLTNDEARVRGCISRIGPGAGAARFDFAITQGYQALQHHRGSNPDGVGLLEVLVVVPASAGAVGCQPVLEAAAAVKHGGARIYAACLGLDCDAACMIRVANTPAQFYSALNPADAPAVMQRIAAEILGQRARRLAIEDELPANIELVEGSDQPVAEWDVGIRTLRWRIERPTSPLTLTYRIRPLEAGTWPANVRAWVTLSDFSAQTGTADFPVPLIEVLLTLPSPTPTASSTPTASPSPSSTPTATPTPSPRAAYLPWGNRN